MRNEANFPGGVTLSAPRTPKFNDVTPAIGESWKTKNSKRSQTPRRHDDAHILTEACRVEFAHGKRLLLLPRPVRDRADAFCDACGSSQPRTLCTLKDLESERYYFVGTPA